VPTKQSKPSPLKSSAAKKSPTTPSLLLPISKRARVTWQVMILGMVLGQSIGLSIHPSTGLAIGLGAGMSVGMALGAWRDQALKKENKVLEYAEK